MTSRIGGGGQDLGGRMTSLTLRELGEEDAEDDDEADHDVTNLARTGRGRRRR